ncbi:MAG: class I SAM-dependent methyltransferase [bacterium]|nr:class I SAM-dependent methyltransferase [bacterium]
MKNPACRFCGAPLETSFADLGETPLANSYLQDKADQIATERSYPLHAMVCGQCFLVQLDTSVPADEIFDHDYAYFSSFSKDWLAHAKRYSKDMTERFGLGKESLVVEVASNDGYLLRYFVEQAIPVLGIEPAGAVAQAAIEIGVPTKICFFDETSGKALADEGIKADLIAANNVFAHVPDIRFFAAGFPKILKSQGVVTFEFPHLLNLIEGYQFDTIYHEHYSYLSLLSVEKVLAAVGMRVFDVSEHPTHGGSLRVFACHVEALHETQAGLSHVRAKEAKASLDQLMTYQHFSQNIAAIRDDFLAFLARVKEKNAQIVAYGAAAKGNTFLNYCGVTSKDINFVVDRNPAKQNHLLPGSHIPVRTPEALAKEKPDYVIILPWNLFEEISTSMTHISSWGGRFVTAIPQVKIW